MIKYISGRVVTSIISLVVVTTIVFFLIRLLPGDPFTSERALTESQQQALEEKFGLDKSLPEQYFTYVKGLLKGDFGPSLKSPANSVNSYIERGFPISAKYGAIAVVVALIFGISLGVIAALYHEKIPDKIVVVLTTMGYSIPSFVMGTLLVFIFANKLRILPATGYEVSRNLGGYILPIISLSALAVATITRLTRSKLIEVLNQDYIRTAKAKGLSQRKVVFKHALKNSLIPVVTYLGTLIAGLLTGSFVVERIFAIPGLGKSFVESIGNRDYTLILGVTIFYSAFVIIMNLLVDIVYVFIDPRVKLQK